MGKLSVIDIFRTFSVLAVVSVVCLPIFWIILCLACPRRQCSLKKKSLRIAFVHPDLGIGGAERLVVDAAVALKEQGHQVFMYTARHEAHHSFEETRDGTLCVLVFGDFLPRRIFGRLYAACAYLRMAWVCLAGVLATSFSDAFDVIIVDQISIAVPLLLLARPCGVIFYCHYPDFLLTTRSSLLKRLYRAPLDWLEQVTTGMADVIFVNSKFTAGVFAEAFPRLHNQGIKPTVLYPPLNLKQQDQILSTAAEAVDVLSDGEQLLVSLNRFERKKNVGLAIRAFAALPGEVRQRAKLVVAGGYDERLPENVEHAAELKELARELGVAERVVQKWSISTAEKATLLKHASCLLYTPDREHFGIVPLEGMYARVPVLAVNSGGPTESIEDGETGFLREADPQVWAKVIEKLLGDKTFRRGMGDAGHALVAAKFGLEAFARKLDNTCRQLAVGLPP